MAFVSAVDLQMFVASDLTSMYYLHVGNGVYQRISRIVNRGNVIEIESIRCGKSSVSSNDIYRDTYTYDININPFVEINVVSVDIFDFANGKYHRRVL